MNRYCLNPDEFARLTDEYGTDTIDYVYGLRMLEICIEKASDIYGKVKGFENFIEWLEELSRNVDEGFEYINRYIDSNESDESNGNESEENKYEGTSGEENEQISFSEFTDLMQVVAEGLESVLDGSPSASIVPNLTDEEHETLEEAVELVVEKLTEVGFETYHFLIGALFHRENLTPGSATAETGLREVGSLFADKAAELENISDIRESESRLVTTQIPAR